MRVLLPEIRIMKYANVKSRKISYLIVGISAKVIIFAMPK